MKHFESIELTTAPEGMNMATTSLRGTTSVTVFYKSPKGYGQELANDRNGVVNLSNVFDDSGLHNPILLLWDLDKDILAIVDDKRDNLFISLFFLSDAVRIIINDYETAEKHRKGIKELNEKLEHTSIH